MKKFFVIITLFCTLLSSAANAAETPILIENGNTYVVIASVPKMYGETVYENSVAIKSTYGTYLLIRSKNSEETVICFRANKAFSWNILGVACSDLKDIKVNINHNGWELTVSGKDCCHVYEKNGATYAKVK